MGILNDLYYPSPKYGKAITSDLSLTTCLEDFLKLDEIESQFRA